MCQSKPNKGPQLDARVRVRARRDALVERQARGEVDLGGLAAGVEAPGAEAGPAPVMGAWTRRPPADEHASLRLSVERLRAEHGSDKRRASGGRAW